MSATLTATIGWTVWEAQPDLSDYNPRGGTVIEEGRDDGGEYVVAVSFRRSGNKTTAHRVRLYRSQLGQHEPPFGPFLTKVRSNLCSALSTRFDPDLWQGLVNIVEVLQ